VGNRSFIRQVFDIDISVDELQICRRGLPIEAIKMDKVYELSRRERFDALLMDKTECWRNRNEYYHGIQSVKPPR